MVVVASACAIALACFVLLYFIETLGRRGDGTETAPAESGKPGGGTVSAGSGSVDPTPSSEEPPDCTQLLAMASSSQLLQQQRENRLRRFLDAIEEQHDRRHRCLVADRGVRSQEVTRMGCQRYPHTPVHALNRPRPRPSIAEDVSRKLLAAYEAGGLQGAFDYAANKPTVLQARWMGTSLLGHFIRRDPSQLRQTLYDVPAQAFGAHELAVAIEVGISLQDFDVLLGSSSVASDPAAAGIDELARSAAINARPDILQLLIGRGAIVAKPDSSVLDDIALLLPSDHDAALQDVASALAAAGDRPHRPSTLATFERWLPSLAAPPLHPVAAHLSESALVMERAAELEVLWNELTLQVDAARDIERRCAFWDATPAASDRADLGFAAKQRYEDGLTDDEAVEKKVQRLMDLYEEMKTDLHVREMLQALEEMQAHADAGRWADAMAVASEWTDAGLEESLLDDALSRGAPLQTIMDMVDLAGGVPDHAILRLTQNPWPGSAVVADALHQNYGLDLNFVGIDGRNAFANVAERFFIMSIHGELNEPALELAKFLTAHSVPMHGTPYGLDALDRVLHEVVSAPFTVPAATGFARYLIDAGASVERSHFELMDAIRGSDLAVYERIVEAVPELRRW